MTNIEAKWLQEIRDNTKQLKRMADKLDVIARLVVNKSEADTPQTEKTCDNCGQDRRLCQYCIEEDRMWTP
jgi:hypothetical protein